MRIEVLGPLRVTGNGRVEPTRPSHRRLLSLLVMEAGRRIGTERLIDMYWGDSPPAEAKAALQTHVSALRRLLGPDLVMTEGYGYRLALENVSLDAIEFDAAAAKALKAATEREWETALDAASAALALWRGTPYPELEDDEFARPELARLAETRLALCETLSGSLLALDRPAEALPELERLVMESPYRERLWEHLMTARYRLGRSAEALRAYRQLNDHLAEIGLEPSRSLQRLEEKILLHHSELTATPHNLPTELDSFVGRETEIREITKAIADNRLVTLTGPGGSGKTRLAVRIARDLLDEFADGVWFVDLAPLRDPGLIPSEVASVLGLRPKGDPINSLRSALASDRTLILLDNCEHLEKGPARLARVLLDSATELRILATTRFRLRVPGEALYEVPGLSLDDDPASIDPVGNDAVRLFTDRASRAMPDFALAANIRDVVSLCRRLDGMPLAIELAAAQSAMVDVKTLTGLLKDRIDILSSGSATGPKRHETLAATIEWSHDLLTGQEQAILRRLGVFRDGFDLDMATRVCSDDETVPPSAVTTIVLRLAENSLVTRYEWNGAFRYRLLETVRVFALDRLADAGEVTATRRRHVDWCLDFVESMWEAYDTEEWETVLERCHVEYDNLNEASDWAHRERRADVVGRLAEAAALHRNDLGYLDLARRQYERALESVTDPEAEARIRAAYAGVLFSSNESNAALEQARRAHELARTLPASPVKANALARYAGLLVLLVDQDPEAALPVSWEAVEVAVATGKVVTEIKTRLLLARNLAWTGYPEEAVVALAEAEGLLPKTSSVAIAVGFYGLAMDAVVFIPGHRHLLAEYARRLVDLAESEDAWDAVAPGGWFDWGLIQAGDFDTLSEIDQRHYSTKHHEGYDRLGRLATHAVRAWMQGRLEEAAGHVEAAEEIGINPRWYHDYLPLKADVAADRGQLDLVRETAHHYLDTEVHASEEFKKIGVLNPLVRAEVDAALAAEGNQRDLHATAAREAAQTAETLMEEFRPKVNGSNQMETSDTHLAFIKAEVSRLVAPDPELWREARDRSDFAYFRLYAQTRLAEALDQVGNTEEASQLIDHVRVQANRLGTQGLLRLVNEIAASVRQRSEPV